MSGLGVREGSFKEILVLRYEYKKLQLQELYCSTFTLHIILEITLQYLTQDNQLIITI